MSDSFWAGTAGKPRRRPALTRDESADVCVVGAGFAGLMTALRLLRAGRSVVVLDKGDVGAGESLRTTAHLGSYQDDGMAKLESLHGEQNARLAYAAHASAVDEIERLVADEGLDCSFRRVDGWLIAEGKEQAARLEEEAAACKRTGIPFERFPRGPRLRFPRQGTLQAGRFLFGLADAVERRGGRIYCRTRVEKIEGGPRPSALSARGARVQAKAVVVATNAPIDERVSISGRQAAYRTYVIAFRIEKGSVSDALYWDMSEHYHYVRVAQDKRGDVLLVGGGVDHRTGQADDPFERLRKLEAWARRRYPEAGRVLFRWSGQVQEPADALGFYGRHPTEQGEVYVATGDSGQGVTGSALASLIISDLILGRENRFAALFSPSRVTPAAAGTLLKENALSVSQGYKRHVLPDEVDSPSKIKPGEGAVMRRGLHKTAVFRREDGTIVERSAICPHLGGVVCWNAFEKSWDCPAHGSRFSPEGENLCGPAATPLQELERPARREAPGERPSA